MTRRPPLRPETEALVQQSAAELVSPDIATMRRVAASIDGAFDRAKLRSLSGAARSSLPATHYSAGRPEGDSLPTNPAVRAARQIAETETRTDAVEKRRKDLAA